MYIDNLNVIFKIWLEFLKTPLQNVTNVPFKPKTYSSSFFYQCKKKVYICVFHKLTETTGQEQKCVEKQNL